jgi:hypothetical protein
MHWCACPVIEKNANYAGLFGEIIGAIRNLSIENATIKGGWYAGGFAGRLQPTVMAAMK